MINKKESFSVAQDEDLAEEVAGGSVEAFNELMNRYYRKLTLFIRRGTATEEDAEDIVQDTFAKAFQHMNRYKAEWKFSTWLYTIGIRTRIDYYRRMKKDTEPLLVDVAVREDRDKLLDFKSLISLARNLRPKQYEVLWLKYVEDLSVYDISEVLGRNQVSVRVLLHRARTNLYKLVNSGESDILEVNPGESG